MKLKTRVPRYPGSAITLLAIARVGTPPAIHVGMQQLALTADQEALLAVTAPSISDDATLMSMPLADAKHLVAAEFERRYLVRVMARAGGSVSEGARLAGLDRTNFRRLLQRHGLR